MKKYLPIIIAVLIIAIIIFLGWKYLGWFKKDPSKEDTKKTLEEAKGGVSWPLKSGSTGPAILAIQKYVNSPYSEFECMGKARENVMYKGKKLFPLKEDSAWGGATTKAIGYCYRTDEVTETQYDDLINKLSA